MEPRVLRVTELEALADEWHLCLLAEGVPHRIEPVDGKLAVVVRDSEGDCGHSSRWRSRRTDAESS
jgi:hypothetical protein